eukprot:TRINITY_DN21359_c0_g1_i1.p1 TRINITY_DN21359_c0_g1~~TRINITY_DN21359_c0_g1_i1.p1  ORF type:complete len:189 (-),score=30.91 TRINITY_DN21359_c0_g1_i1:134-700(-)
MVPQKASTERSFYRYLQESYQSFTEEDGELAQQCWNGVKERMKDSDLAAGLTRHLSDRGVKASDIPKAFAGVQLLTSLEWCGLLFLSCRYTFLSRLAASQPGCRLRAWAVGALGGYVPRAEKYMMEKAEQFGESRFVRPIPKLFNMVPSNFTLALLETQVIYYITWPGLVLCNFWIVSSYFERRLAME